MSLRSRNGFLLLLLLFSAAALLGQSRVNPTVKVLPRASAPVPAECDEGLAPQPAPRVQTVEVQPVERDRATDLLPPPSRDLRSQLSDALDAAERNDREGFRAALAAAKTTLASYPPGGERNAGNEAVAVFNDIDRLWEYQYSSPIGAFFDETVQGGGLLSALRKYRGYDEFIRKNVITDANGTRLYPTRESREFLTREASERLARVGIAPVRPRTTTAPATASTAPATPERRADQVVTVPRTAPATKTPAARSTTKAPRPTQTARAGTTAPRRSARRSTSRSTAPREPQNEGKPSETQPTPSRQATAKPAPVRPAPAAAAPPPVKAAAPPATATATTATTATETTATETTATETAATATETTATETSAVDSAFATDTTSTAAPARPARSRNVILPIILILVGVGVLIVLFRASS